MTFKELPEYCAKHMCKSWVTDCKGIVCEHQGLCTRFYNKYGITPMEYFKRKKADEQE